MRHSEVHEYRDKKEYEKLGEMGYVCRGLDEARIPYDLFTAGKPIGIDIFARDVDFEVERIGIVFPPVEDDDYIIPVIEFNGDGVFRSARVESAYPMGYDLWGEDEDIMGDMEY